MGFCQLELKNTLMVVTECHFTRQKIVPPHPAKPFIVKVARGIDVGHETVVPMAQRFGVMQTPYFDICRIKVLFLKRADNFGHRR